MRTKRESYTFYTGANYSPQEVTAVREVRENLTK